MNWQTILKQPKLRTGSKITTTLGRDSKEDEEGRCFEKLKEYQEKIMSKTRILDKNIRMEAKFILNDMPEEVACAALKSINEMKFPEFGFDYYYKMMVDGEMYYVEPMWGNPLQNVVTMSLQVDTFDKTIIKFEIKITANYRLSPDEIKKYSEVVNWRDN